MTPYEQLDALYATLPTVKCKRLCQQYCGPILVPKIEARRLEEKRGYLATVSSFEAARGIHLPAPELIEREMIGIGPDSPAHGLSCVFLNTLGNCTAYSIRPLVCRCWGVVDHPLLRCPHGCVPDRWLSPMEFKQLIENVIAIQKDKPHAD